MADEYKINVRDVDDTSSAASGAYYVPIDDIGSGGGGGGSELPAVTSDDNGDVLTVVEGEWAKAPPSGGVLVCNFAFADETITCDKTLAEINTAVQAGQFVRGTYDIGIVTLHLSLMYAMDSMCSFVGYTIDDNEHFAVLELLYSTAEITTTEHPFA